MNENKDKVFNKTSINWYPGHMAKTKREIKEKISLIDIIVEVVDARIPYSSNIKDIDDIIKNKEKIIVMSKYDLCDKAITEKWINYYLKKDYKVIPVDLKNSNSHKKVITEIEDSMKKINDKRKNKGLLPKKAKVLVIGVPNVGKSTLINRLTNKKIASVGNKPGVTKALSWIKINKNIDLLDSPGILWPKIEENEIALNLAAMGTIKEEILPLDEVAVHILQKLNENYKDKLEQLYNIKEFNIDDIIDTYEKISNYRNIKRVNNDIDYDRINILIINDIKSEKLKGITFDNL